MGACFCNGLVRMKSRGGWKDVRMTDGGRRREVAEVASADAPGLRDYARHLLIELIGREPHELTRRLKEDLAVHDGVVERDVGLLGRLAPLRLLVLLRELVPVRVAPVPPGIRLHREAQVALVEAADVGYM